MNFLLHKFKNRNKKQADYFLPSSFLWFAVEHPIYEIKLINYICLDDAECKVYLHGIL